ncbi:MAG: thioredoxin domain-containing protein [Thermoleophilia bacterium]
MKITCYLSPACGSEEELKTNIVRALAAENISADVSIQRIDNEKAAKLRLSGSPSVFINGTELQPIDTTGFS